MSSVFQNTNEHNIYKSYTYVLFGPERVGKTNIITRFVKDQFTQAHNMTLQGQQSVIVNIDSRKFQIFIHDTAGQQNLYSMKAVWRNNKDGYVFVYALNDAKTFSQMVEELIEIKSHEQYRNIPVIVIANKLDLKSSREVDRKWAENQLKKFDLKLFEVSAKMSQREEIQAIFVELIEKNEMNQFREEEQETMGHIEKNQAKIGIPCCRESDDMSSRCQIF